MGRGFWDVVGDLTGANYVGGKIADLGGGIEDLGKDIWGGLKSGYNGVKDAIDKPYQDQRAGLESIQQRLMQLKGERLARKDQTYNQANAQYDDTRKAMKYAFGDPSNWKL